MTRKAIIRLHLKQTQHMRGILKEKGPLPGKIRSTHIYVPHKHKPLVREYAKLFGFRVAWGEDWDPETNRVKRVWRVWYISTGIKEDQAILFQRLIQTIESAIETQGRLASTRIKKERGLLKKFGNVRKPMYKLKSLRLKDMKNIHEFREKAKKKEWAKWENELVSLADKVSRGKEEKQSLDMYFKNLWFNIGLTSSEVYYKPNAKNRLIA